MHALKALFIASIVLLLQSCSLFFTSQPIEKMALLELGMSEQEAEAIMGSPIRTELSEERTVWHYCRTKRIGHEFGTLIFQENRLMETHADTLRWSESGEWGDCQSFLKSQKSKQ